MSDIINPQVTDFEMGDILLMRKPHPCGGYEWKVIRLGADIGLECLTCQRRVLVPRRQLCRRVKRIHRLSSGEQD